LNTYSGIKLKVQAVNTFPFIWFIERNLLCLPRHHDQKYSKNCNTV